jgi:hypothetical protein
MISPFNRIIISTVFIIASVTGAMSEDKNNGLREIGKVLFVNTSSTEVMVFSSLETPSLYITKGSILEIGKGDKLPKITVSDICGLYIRCSIVNNSSRRLNSFKEGDVVYLSESGNASVKYSDVKIVLSVLIKLYEDFIFRIESVDEPAVISEYIESFSSDLEKLIPELEQLNSKYPELMKFYTEPPAELKYESETLKLLEPALGNAFFKIKMYAEDPAIKRSIERLNRVLEKIRRAGK